MAWSEIMYSRFSTGKWQVRANKALALTFKEYFFHGNETKLKEYNCVILDCSMSTGICFCRKLLESYEEVETRYFQNHFHVNTFQNV